MDENFQKTWRYKIGLSLFIFGNLLLLSALVLPLLGISGASLVTALVIGGEVFSMSSIVFLGKAGFMALKKKLFGAVKAQLFKPVGPVRHYLGVTLLCINAIFLYLIVLYAMAAVDSVTKETPFLWGMNLSDQTFLVYSLFLVGEVCFVASLFVLGPDWWGRFRRLFVWQKTDQSVKEVHS